ncbi:MAG: helix-turn-helix domain-containing protein [Burkholderiaceae bacterium]|nr:helix-turn-helix domain-containing protein [Burkholderiaceae bacterium]
MNAFDQQLLRLKQELRVSEDQQVAELLGMTKAGLSARKRRQSFPRTKVEALAAGRPELRLDTVYIFTGETQQERARRTAADAISGTRRKRAHPAETALYLADDGDTTDGAEGDLVDSYRRCAPADKKLALDLVARLAKR